MKVPRLTKEVWQEWVDHKDPFKNNNHQRTIWQQCCTDMIRFDEYAWVIKANCSSLEMKDSVGRVQLDRNT